MSEHSQPACEATGQSMCSTRCWLRRIVVAAIALPGIVVLLWYLFSQWHAYALRVKLSHADPEQRAAALLAIAGERDQQAREPVRVILAAEQDRPVLEMAAYTAMRLRDTAALPLLQTRADTGPDDAVRARLIQFAARLSNIDLRLSDWLRQASEDASQPWRQVGGAIGLLEVADPRGGPLLISIARSPQHPGNGLAIEALRLTVKPMTEAVGWPMPWPEDLATADDEFWKQLGGFWNQPGTLGLLSDIHNRRYAWDPQWYELNRLLHARDKVARFFE